MSNVSRRAAWIGLLAAVWIHASGVLSADLPPDPRQIWQLLDYLAVDYAGAVSNGEIVSAAEYAEMREFAATARQQVAALPANASREGLLKGADELFRAIEHRSPAGEVSRIARSLADSLLATYPVPMAPISQPDLARGKQLFETDCSACHGMLGAADGPAAQSLDPPPVAFTDRERARQRSPFGYYQVITQGVSGTSMASFAALPEADRWALAFYAGTLAFSPAEITAGRSLWNSQPHLRAELQSLEAISRASELALQPSLGSKQAGPLVAYVRAHPEAVTTGSKPGFALARARLAASVKSYEAGDVDEARRLALSAYLDGVEPVEPLLAAASPGLKDRIEIAMGRYRSMLGTRAERGEIADQAREIEGILELSDQAMSAGARSSGTAFLGSFIILLREGVEALLIVMAIVVFLRKADRQELLPYVHAGWMGALLAGVFTWGFATYLVEISGAQREVTEGVSSLFAAAVLVSVGLWMHRKSIAGRWQQYLREKLTHALTRRSVWFLAGLAFIAVYREVFETILFYAALWTQGQHAALLAGLAAGALALVAAGYFMLRATMRLPIGKFFSVSAWLVGILAIVLVGKGIGALQEAGMVGFRLIDGPRIDVLGVYPSAQTVLAQLLVAATVFGGFFYNNFGLRKAP